MLSKVNIGEYYVHLARMGCPEELFSRLRNPSIRLHKEEREYLANLIEGNEKRRGRVARYADDELELVSCLEWLVEIERVKREAAEELIAEKSNQTSRNVRKLRLKYKPFLSSLHVRWMVRPPKWRDAEIDIDEVRDQLLRSMFSELLGDISDERWEFLSKKPMN